jgi:hypothetical protein
MQEVNHTLLKAFFEKRRALKRSHTATGDADFSF